MAWSARARWIVYGIAALATASAMRWVDEASVRDATIAAPATPRSMARAVPATRPGDEARVRLDWLARSPMGDVKGDPFAPGRTEPAPAQPVAPAPVPVPVPQAPPLPFTYLGKWTEDGRTTVFLARGGNHVAVRGVGKLDASYAVESIDDRQIVLRYLPLDKQQVLSLGPPPAGTQPAEQVATAPSESSEGTQEDNN